MWEYEEMVALAAPGTVLAEFRDSGVAHMIRVASYNRCAALLRRAPVGTAARVRKLRANLPHASHY